MRDASAANGGQMDGVLVLIETGSNQSFIFATNKLAENLGASQMIWRVGVEFVLKGVTANTGRVLFDRDPGITRRNLLNPDLNPLFNGGRDEIEVITAASGKALLLVGSREIGKRLVSFVTLRALRYTPGVDVRGFVGAPFALTGADLDAEVRRVHEGLAGLRGQLPAADLRFPQLPVVAPCANSGRPASHNDLRAPGVDVSQSESGLRSEVSISKRRHVPRAVRRMQGAVSSAGMELPRNLNELERLQGGRQSRAAGAEPIRGRPLEWMGVVHADGNGLGQLFLNFGQESKTKSNWRDYFTTMRAFSLGIDDCTEAAAKSAFKAACERNTENDSFFPAVPLVLGGDDLTLVCDGKMAIRLAHDFLVSFHHETKCHAAVNKVASQGLTASAGVAIVKPHFPFHLAYELSESLLKSAKKYRPNTAIDFHVHYDASGSDLKVIRDRLRQDSDRTVLFARPYLLPSPGWSRLYESVDLLNERTDDDESGVPSTLLHELRSALFMGRVAGEQRLQRIFAQRGNDRHLERLFDTLHNVQQLFISDDTRELDDKSKTYFTALTDLLDAREFWK